MLTVKTAEEVWNAWEKEVDDKITEEQKQFRTDCGFGFVLPEFIISQLRERGYEVKVDKRNPYTYVSWEKAPNK